LVDVQQGSAEEEDRREDEQGKQRGDADRLIPKTVEDDDEHQSAEEDRDHERGERAELVYEVRAREPRAAAERVGEAASLDDRGGNRERDEAEVRERDEVESGNDDDPLHEQRQERDAAGDESDARVPALRAEGEATRASERVTPASEVTDLIG